MGWIEFSTNNFTTKLKLLYIQSTQYNQGRDIYNPIFNHTSTALYTQYEFWYNLSQPSLPCMSPKLKILSTINSKFMLGIDIQACVQPSHAVQMAKLFHNHACKHPSAQMKIFKNNCLDYLVSITLYVTLLRKRLFMDVLRVCRQSTIDWTLETWW